MTRRSWYLGHVAWEADDGPALVILRRCGSEAAAERERVRLRRPAGEVFAARFRLSPGTYHLEQVLAAARASGGEPLCALHTF